MTEHGFEMEFEDGSYLELTRDEAFSVFAELKKFITRQDENGPFKTTNRFLSKKGPPNFNPYMQGGGRPEWSPE